MIKKLFRIILKFKRTATYGKRSSKNFVEYLENSGVQIGNNVNFRYPKSAVIDMTRPSLIEIGDNVDINANFTLMTHDFGTYVFRNIYRDFVASSGKVKIGNNIYFGRNVTILKGTTIGNNCIIGLGSVITKDIPDNSVAVGAPCRVICSIEDYYQRRKKAQIEEALEYGVSIWKNLKREPVITDFREEWVLFLTKEDYKNFPKIRSEVDFRIGEFRDYWFEHNQLVFDGYKEFLKAVHVKYNEVFHSES